MKALEKKRGIWAAHEREGSDPPQLSGLTVSWPVLSELSHCLLFMLRPWPLLGITSLCLCGPKLSTGYCPSVSSFHKVVRLNTLQPSVSPSCLFFIFMNKQCCFLFEYFSQQPFLLFHAYSYHISSSSYYFTWRMGEIPEDQIAPNVERYISSVW